jgi:hypothetical protein
VKIERWPRTLVGEDSRDGRQGKEYRRLMVMALVESSRRPADPDDRTRSRIVGGRASLCEGQIERRSSHDGSAGQAVR